MRSRRRRLLRNSLAEDKNHIGLPLFCQDCRRVFDRREGRPDEIILKGKAGLKDTAVFSIGSDGTDGPTDAAGGFCDGGTEGLLRSAGLRSPGCCGTTMPIWRWRQQTG